MKNYKKYNLVNDLGFIKTGIKEYVGVKKYYSTGSIKKNDFVSEGKYDFNSRPLRANREVQKNDVLQARMFDTDKSILIDDNLNNCLVSTGFFQFRPPKETIIPKLLYYILSSKMFLNKKNSLCTGSTQKAINDESLKRINIILPTISEQQNIVKKLDKIFDNIKKNILLTKNKINELDLLFDSFLLHSFNSTDKNWKKVQLKDLCLNYKNDIVDGPFGSNLKSEHFIKEGVIVLKIQNIKKFLINSKKLSYVSYEKFIDLKRHTFKVGDIIMTKLGAPLGVSAIVENINEGVIVADLVRIRAKKINTEFLCFQLNSKLISSYINSMQKGATRPRIKLSVVRELPIKTTNNEKQIIIVKRLKKILLEIDNLKNIYLKKNINLELLKNSLINNYLSNEMINST